MAEHATDAILAAEAAEAEQHHLLEERLPPLGGKPHVGDPAPALLRAETDKQAGGHGDGSETEDEEAPSASVKFAPLPPAQQARSAATGATASFGAAPARPAAAGAGAGAGAARAGGAGGAAGATPAKSGGSRQVSAATTATGAKKRPPARGASGVTLKVLIGEGIIAPGKDVLTVEYKGQTQTATLTEEGRIVTLVEGKEHTFESPSSFSIFMKRLVNPTRKADDGWKTVRYGGKVLEHYKLELVRKRMGGAVPADSEPSMKRQRLEGSTSNLSALSKGAASSNPSRPPLASPQVTGAEVVPGSNRVKLKLARPKPVASDAATPRENGAAGGGDVLGYGKARPRRQVRAPTRFAALGSDDEHALQPLEAYGTGAPGEPGAQPFRLQVSPAAELMMDCHAHLSTNEVIGILAGTWEPGSRCITVSRAFPVRELCTEDDSVNVEMDSEDEFRVRQEVEGKHGLRVVGWYHSHPTFPTQPSLIDIYNQVLQQHHHRDEASGQEPYVAAIVGPYDRRLPSPTSSLTWFYVDHPQGRVPEQGQSPLEAGCTAKALQAEALPLGEEPRASAELMGLPTKEMQQLARRYAPEAHGVQLEGSWRGGEGGGSRLEKLVESLKSRLPLSWTPRQAKDFGEKVLVSMRAVWAVFGLNKGGGGGGGASGGAHAAGPAASSAQQAQHDEDEEISDDEVEPAARLHQHAQQAQQAQQASPPVLQAQQHLEVLVPPSHPHSAALAASEAAAAVPAAEPTAPPLPPVVSPTAPEAPAVPAPEPVAAAELPCAAPAVPSAAVAVAPPAGNTLPAAAAAAPRPVPAPFELVHEDTDMDESEEEGGVHHDTDDD